jgi:hypothetical protein
MVLSAGGRLGPYQVVGLLGAGGMGVVYRARDPRLGRDVAIKVLPEEMSQDPKRLERFEREARAVGALSHPNILSVHDVGSENGAPYVVFELLEGETLRERLGSGPLPAQAAVDFGIQVARGLVAAHRQGIVHRDLKPENLLVARAGLLKILDFGLAKSRGPEDGAGATELTASGVTEPGGRLGTAAYMSPEQARGEAVDHRSDLFSLGVVIQEMLSGASPFRRETAADTIVAILRESPPALPPAVAADVPSMGAIIARCLAKDPEHRFQSAADLEFALRQALAPAVPAGPLARAPTASRRLGALALLLAFAAGAALVFVGRGTPPEPPGFRKLTARPGAVASALFSPDGYTVLFSGSWTGSELRTFEQRIDALEPRPLDLPPGRVVGSAGGEYAIVTASGPQTGTWSGSLIRTPLQGGGARVVAEAVVNADWAADGSAFAITRTDGGRARVEYPPGRTLYETAGALAAVRISPDGKRVAFIEHPVRGHLESRVGVVDAVGAATFRGRPKVWIRSIAWSADGREVWFTYSGWGQSPHAEAPSGWSLGAVTLSGRERLLLRLPDTFRVLAVSARGNALLSIDQLRRETVGRLAGDLEERDLAFRDGTFLLDIAHDGRTILFADRDTRYGRVTAYLRRAAEAQPVRLEQGEPHSLSPDGTWVTLYAQGRETLRLIPTGAGDAVTLPMGTIDRYYNSRWLPDGRRLLVAAQEKDRPKRLFLQDVPSGLPRPVTPEGVMNMYPAISPDGMWVAAGLEQKSALQSAWPLGGGEPRPLRGLVPGDWVVRWSDDGRFVFAYDPGRVYPPWPVVRVDLETGRREVWKELTPPGASGATQLLRVHVTPDGRSYGYTFERAQSDLYLVSGLR